MLKISRSLLVASAFLAIGAASGSVQAADDPIFLKAKEAFDAIGKGTAEPAPPLVIVTSGELQVVKPAPQIATPAAPPVATPVNPPLQPVPAKTCADGKCAAPAACAPPPETKSCCSCLKKVCHWFAFDGPETSCDCFARPMPFCPSAYAWFPLVPGMTCATPGGCCAPATHLVAGKHCDPPLPQPQMPKMATAEKPLVPGSLSVLTNDKDAATTTPVNYKSLPTAPNAALPAGSR